VRWRDSYVVDPGTGCWWWTGPVEESGYGKISDGYLLSHQAHRYVWTQVRGPIPDSLVLDHLCRVNGCVNPDHLEPVTQKVNVERGELNDDKRAMTECLRGHEFTAANTRWHGNRRHCRTCDRMWWRQWNVRRKRAAAERRYEGSLTLF
jgi:hypothetical protein